MAEKLRITLVKSPIGAIPKQRATVEALGLGKMHKTVEMPDNGAVRGMIPVSYTHLWRRRRSSGFRLVGFEYLARSFRA